MTVQQLLGRIRYITMSKCNGCSQIVSTAERISCSTCSNIFNYSCVNISKDNFSKLSNRARASWKCPECKLPRKGGDNSETPVKSAADHGDAGALSSIDVIDSRLLNFESTIRQSIESQIKLQFEAFRASFELIPGLVRAIEQLTVKHDEVRADLAHLRSEASELRTENVKLRDDVRELNFRVAQMEQKARQNNIEIQCLPEKTNENLTAMVIQLGKTVSYPIKEEDILFSTRVAKNNRGSTRPRSVIVKLSSSQERDGLLAACRTFNRQNPSDKLNSAHLGSTGSAKQLIYVAEHLSPANRVIQAKARVFKREHGYEHLWTRDGRVLLKKDFESPTIWVRDIEVLSTLLDNVQIDSS